MKINGEIINTAVRAIRGNVRQVETSAVSNPLVKAPIRDILIKEIPLLRTPLTKKEIANIKPREFKAIIESRTDIPNEVISSIKTPSELSFYDTLNNILLETNVPYEKRINILNNFINNSEPEAAAEVVQKLAKKGYDLEYISQLPIDELNKDVVEQVLNNRTLIDKYVQTEVPVIKNVQQKIKETKEEIANLKKQANCDEFELWERESYLRRLEEYAQGVPQKKAEVQFLTSILFRVDKNNVKYIEEYYNVTGDSIYDVLHLWKDDTAKICQNLLKLDLNRSVEFKQALDRINRRKLNYNSVQKILGDVPATETTQRMLEYPHFEKFKDIDLTNFNTLTTAEKKEFLGAYINAITTKEACYPGSLLDNFGELASRMKIYKGFDTSSREAFAKSYHDTLQKIMDSIPNEEKITIASPRINYNKYHMTSYRDKNPIPALVDDLSKLPYREEVLNGKTYRIIEMESENSLGIATHRIPNGDSILNIEALEMTNPEEVLCIGQKDIVKRGINGGKGDCYSLFTRPRKGNDLWFQSFTDVDSGNHATKNILNIHRLMRTTYRRSHGQAGFRYIPELLKKELNLSQAEYTSRMSKLRDCTTLDEIAKIDKEFEQAIRKVIHENEMYEGLIRPDIMGIKIPYAKPLSEINQNILSYAQRHNIPLIRIHYPEPIPKQKVDLSIKITS